ncbi:MAG: binding-protein-dependent transport system inner membrane component [Candidatus Rokubacteria bacterium CSP1-6]|nr:MAG: binding-protein-dependent transport system inner membrane component [Candidatus Rokubacteria bacterium CSP1-6]
MARFPGKGLAVLLGCLVLWEVLARQSGALALYFPPASQVLATLAAILGNGELLDHIAASLLRFAEGYALAAALAVSAGLCFGLWRPLYALFEPLIELLRPMPSPATIPIAILFLGIGDQMKVAVTVYACFWPILLNTIDGVRAIDPVLMNTAATFRLGPWERFRKVVLPAASPQIVTGLRVSLAIALILVTTSEMVVSNDGLGFYILDRQRSFQIPEMYAAIVALAMIGYGLNRLFLTLDGWAMAWHKGLTRKEEIL